MEIAWHVVTTVGTEVPPRGKGAFIDVCEHRRVTRQRKRQWYGGPPPGSHRGLGPVKALVTAGASKAFLLPESAGSYLT